MNKLPLLPLRDIVIFPDMIVPLFVGREKSVLAIEEVMKKDKDDKKILLLTQKDSLTDNPGKNDLYKVGVLANILQMLKLPDGTVKVLVEGLTRVKIFDVTDDKFLSANSKDYHEKVSKKEEGVALVPSISDQFGGDVKVKKKVS